MRIILLRGKKHTGKTPTLELVRDWLKQQNGVVEKPLKNPRLFINQGSNDFEANFYYCGKDVAIYSLGDTFERIREAIFKYSETDVLILAHNTDAFKFDEITFGSQHNIVSKNVAIGANQAQQAQLETQANQKDCATICSLI